MSKEIKVVWNYDLPKGVAGQGGKFAMEPTLPIELSSRWINSLDDNTFAAVKELFASVAYEEVMEKYQNKDTTFLIGEGEAHTV